MLGRPYRSTRRNRRSAEDNIPTWWKTPHNEPQPEGVQLLMSGEFGRVSVKRRMYLGGRKGVSVGILGKDEKANKGERQNLDIRAYAGRWKLDQRLRERHTSTRYTPKEDVAEELIPNTNGTIVASYNSNVYCGQYSAGK